MGIEAKQSTIKLVGPVLAPAYEAVVALNRRGDEPTVEKVCAYLRSFNSPIAESAPVHLTSLGQRGYIDFRPGGVVVPAGARAAWARR